MFRIDKRGQPAVFLGFGHTMQRQRGLTGTFRSVDLDDAAFGQTANAQRDIQAQ